jgi:replicative DNA helicase
MEELYKIPPQAIELEQAVLGAIILESDTFSSVAEFISKESFYNSNNAIIFNAIESLIISGQNVDLLTVVEQLRKSNQLDQIGGAHYIATLTNKVGSAAHIEFHAKVIAEKYMRREFIRLSVELQKSMYDDNSELISELNNFDSSKMSLLSFTAKEEKHISEAIHDMKEYCIKLHNNEVPHGIRTGFTYYDDFSGGIQLGDLVIMAGETSNGKTTLALNIGKNTAEKGNSVAIFSYEMTIFQLTARLVAHTNRVSSKDIIRGTFERKAIEKLTNDVTRLKDSPLYLIKPNGSNFSTLLHDINRMVKLYGIKVIIIDYLQLLTNSKKNASQADMVAEMANKLKSLAVELNVAIILLSQLSRDRQKPRPTLARLKGSGDIENAADVVIFTYLPYKYGFTYDNLNGENIQVDENAIIIVGKGRNIGTTEFMLEFNKEIPAFFNYNKNIVPSIESVNYIEPNDTEDFTPF